MKRWFSSEEEGEFIIPGAALTFQTEQRGKRISQFFIGTSVPHTKQGAREPVKI